MTWRVHVEDDYRFALDQLRVLIIKRDGDDTGYVKALTFNVDSDFVQPSGASWDPPEAVTTFMPRELAAALFDALGPHLIGVSDPYNEIYRLRRELEKTSNRLDALIAGIGHLGGQS